jgi:long-chain fatty acid transport protein
MQPRKTKGALRLTTFFHRFQLVAPRLLMLIACGLLSVVVPAQSWSGGLYITEFGTPSNGVANAGAVALANDASTAWHNPAGLTHVSGNQFMGHGGLLIPNIKFDPDSDTPVPGGDGGQAGGLAPIIGTAFVHSLTDKLKLGMALGSLAGAGLDYDNSWAGRRQATEVELLTVTGQPSVAFKHHWLSVGAAFQVSYGSLDYKLKAPALPPPTESTIKIDGDDWAFGFTAGVLIDFSEGSRLGVRYQSKNKFKFDGNLKKSGGLISGKVNSKLEFIFPQYVEVGFYHEVNDQFALVATVDWEDWSQFDEIPLSISTGASGAIPTGWDDTYKLSGGIRYRPSNPWLLMTGFAYDSSPVDAKDRTADLPVDRQLRYAVGAQYQWSERLNIGGNFEYIDLGNAKISNDRTLKGDFKRNEMFFVGLNANWAF